MSNFFKNLVSSEPRPLEELKESITLNRDDTQDFISILEDHHDYLEESISVLMSHEATDLEKQTHLTRFLKVLDMHAKAEEETLYVALKAADDKNARVEGFFGKDEHEVADRLANELKAMGFDISWSEVIDAKAKVLAGLVKNHIKEEETEMFAIAKETLAYEKMTELAAQYLDKADQYLVLDGMAAKISPTEFPTITY